MMFLLRNFPLLWKHNLTNVQLHVVEVVWSSSRFLEQRTTSDENMWRSMSISLIFPRSSKIPNTIHVSLAELMRSIIIFINVSLASKCMFSQSFFNTPFRKLIHPFRIGCFCTLYTFATCLANVLLSCLIFAILLKFPSFCWTCWSKLHFFPRIAEIALYLPSVLLKKSEFQSSCPWNEFDEEREVSGINVCPSSSRPYRMHSSISRAISFVLLPKHVKHELNLLSIDYFAVSLYCSR